MNEILNQTRENASLIVIVLLFVCAYYLERIKVKIDAIHYIMLSRTYPDALKDL
jgi:hypothetical protein